MQADGPPGTPGPSDLNELADTAGRIIEAVQTVIQGKPDVATTAVTVLLAEGHLLIEDVPGVGKTMLAKALAAAIAAPMTRIQFTPDLLPSDITGISVFTPDTRRFEFRAGAIFANIVVCDEINRASPKTQSAVLESMEEAQVTVDGKTYPLPRPFLVVATQNPLEMEGTYPLPEAQRDRFMARLSMGYPSGPAEIAMLDRHGAHDPLTAVVPVTDAERVGALAQLVRGIYASPALKQYIVDLVTASRQTPALRLGASPRASLHLLRAARSAAAIARRDHVLPQDVQRLFGPVIAHRVLLSTQSRSSRRTAQDVLDELLAGVPVPARVG